MGTTPSVQEDLQSLKRWPAKSPQRREAFARLQKSMGVAPLPKKDLLAACAAVESMRFAPWAAPPRPAAPSGLEDRLADRVRGCIFGAALGDAAGLAAEFLGAQEVTDFYGAAPDFRPGSEVYPDEHRLMWCLGDWTDDTDQQLLMLQSLLHCGGKADACDLAQRLCTWREKGFAELGDESAAGLGQTTKAVLNDPSFLADPHSCAARHSGKTPSNGGVMRTAVCGIPNFWDDEVVAQTAEVFCRTTHADPRCVASCLVVSLCVSRLLRGEDTEDLQESIVKPALAQAQEAATDWKDEMSFHAEAELKDLQLDERQKIGYTFKCMGAALWALRRGTSPDAFRSTLNRLILEGGDADTNGTVAGALLGCYLGFSQLPKDWIAGMPYSSWLEAYVQKLLFMLRLRNN